MEIVKGGNLVPEEAWVSFVSGIENGFESLETNKERSKRIIAKTIVESVKRRLVQKFGILFSGGIDSTLIAFISKKCKSSFTCYTVGCANSNDINWSQKIAAEYDFSLKCKNLELEELEFVLRKVVRILGEADVMKVSVGSVLYAAGKVAIADGNNILFGGLGSEEIFAGYQRHEDALKKGGFVALHRECWNGLKGMYKRDLTRDFAISKSLGIELRAPFLDAELIKSAMGVHPMYKIDKENKKIILREAAELIGLKREFAWRKKQAAQYGSSFMDGMEKLAKKNGFKYKKEYLQSLLEKT